MAAHIIVDVALILTGLLITSGLVAFAEWRPEHMSLSRNLLLSWRNRHASRHLGLEAETEKVENEIKLLEKEKRGKSLLQELKARRDSLREEMKGV